MPNLSTLGRLAPAVEPLDDDALNRIHARMHQGRTPRRRRRLLAAPALLAIALPVLVFALASGGGNEPAFAAEAIRVAEAAPRLLVAGGGWKVTRADEWQPGRGEMTFSNGDAELELRWLPAAEYPGMLQSLTDKAEAAGTTRAAGLGAKVYHDEVGVFAALFVDGDSLVLARSRSTDLATFTKLIGSLEHVGVNGWLKAMPADVVRPAAEHASVVDEMVKGLPVPPSLDVAALRQSGSVRDRYQLGAQVSGAVACGWIAQYLAAGKSGDTKAADEAAKAMATARTWPILLEMQADGAYPEVLWMFADALNGKPVMKGTLEASYVGALGCPTG